jgi:hypothetical protein
MTDQPFYDTLFQLRAALVFLARESREAQERRIHALERALKAEARAHCLEIERNYWRGAHLHHLEVQRAQDRRQRRKAA